MASTTLSDEERALLREAARLLDAGAHTINTLLAALKALVARVDSGWAQTDDAEVKAARAAIAKAEQ